MCIVNLVNKNKNKGNISYMKRQYTKENKGIKDAKV